MLALNASSRFWLSVESSDMRKSFDGLIGLTRQVLQENPSSGSFFIFLNRRKTMMKVLYFDQDGYCIWAKRLEKGQFNFEKKHAEKMSLSPLDFQALLSGISYREIRRYQRYK